MPRIIKVSLELEEWADELTLSRRNRYGKSVVLDMELPERAYDNLIDSLAYNTGKTMKQWWKNKEEVDMADETK